MSLPPSERAGSSSPPPCGCRGGGSVGEALRTPGLLDPPKTSGRVSIDRDSLRLALGDRRELVEAMEARQAKATGKPSVNAGRIWSFMTKAMYQSGDLPVLATRECLQNSADACRAAIRARKLRSGAARFDVTWQPRARALTWSDNGIGMSAEDVLTKFLTLGETGKADAIDSGEAAGGFGVAKAVILGASSTFRWMMDTRDNHVTCQGHDAEVAVFQADEPIQGTRITIFDVADEFDETWDRARQEWVAIEDRLYQLLAANDLPKMTLTLNGREVKPMFSRRGGSRVRLQGSWGPGTTAKVKAYRRPPGDRRGAYYIRLGGLFQFRLPARRTGLKADVVIDLTTTVRPGERGYPLNAARDALQERARWAFQDLVDEVEKENESVGRSDEDEVFDPDSEHATEREGARELASLTEQAFADPKLQAALEEATGGIADFYGELAGYAAKREPTASAAPAGTKPQAAEDGPQRTMILPAGFQRAERDDDAEPDVEAPGGAPTVSVRELRATFEVADSVAEANGAPRVLTNEVRQVLDRAELGWPLEQPDLDTLAQAVEQAAEVSMNMGGGGLVQAATVARVFDQVQGSAPAPARRKVNPFGKLAGLRISRKRYDRGRAYRFKKGYARWIPYLAAWDATLRLVATEAQIRRRFKPGFILDDELLGLTTSSTSGANVIYIHPDRMKQVVKAHKQRPLAIAAFLHGIAVHELTHLDGRMGEGHSESYVAAREDLGAATAHLLPAIAVLVTNLLRLPRRKSDEQKRLERLERSLARAKEKAKGCKQAKAQVPELQAEIAQLRTELDQALQVSGVPRPGGDKASAVLDRVAAVLRDQPPAGVEPTHIDRFLNTHRPALLGLVRAGLQHRGQA
jgi:hypothetical protein